MNVVRHYRCFSLLVIPKRDLAECSGESRIGLLQRYLRRATAPVAYPWIRVRPWLRISTLLRRWRWRKSTRSNLIPDFH